MMHRLVSRLILVFMISAVSNAGRASESDALKIALESQPNNVDLRLKLAILLAREGALEEAEKEAEQVVTKAPEYLDAYLLLGRIAGWQHRFEDAFRYVDTVLEKQPRHPEAVALKLDLLKWMANRAASRELLMRLIDEGSATPDIYYRLAEVEKANLRHLYALRHAEAALRLDPNHTPSKALIRDIRRATFHMTEELEYHDFEGDAARDDRLGASLHLAGTAFQNARLSATLTEAIVYRFKTVNHQIGLQADYRPIRQVGFTAAAKLGLPAHVISKGAFLLAVRGEMFKRMDAALSLGVDILPWPEADPALLVRPSVTAGIFLHKKFRIGATYTLGVLRYCDNRPILTHSGIGSAQWIHPRITVSLAAGFAEERDPLAIRVDTPTTCEQIRLLESNRVAIENRFELVAIRTVHTGFKLTLKVNSAATIGGGYRIELRRPDTSDTTIPTHISHFGVTVWF